MNTTTATEALPLALVISVPLVSLTLLSLLLVSAFCLKKTVPGTDSPNASPDARKKKPVGSGGISGSPLPNVVLNPLANQPSPYATSHLLAAAPESAPTASPSIGVNSLSSYKQQQQFVPQAPFSLISSNPASPYRTASVQQKQWRPLLQQVSGSGLANRDVAGAATSGGGDASSAYMEVGATSVANFKTAGEPKKESATGDETLERTNDDEDEEWIEVSNKGNQTPSHWVYSDMIR